MKNRKRMWKRCLAAGLAALMSVSLLACGNKEGSESGKKGTVSVDFLYNAGDLNRMEVIRLLIEEFNNTAGPELGVKVKGIPKTGDADSILSQQLPSNSGADLVLLSDRNFKKFGKYLEDMNGNIEEAVWDDLYENTRNRGYFNVADTTSNSDDPLLGMPVYNDAMVLYYNRTALEKAGVICISVDEENLEAFNAGTAADNRGKTKADYGIDFNVPAKGFYRSVAPFVPAAGERNGASWSRPVNGEQMVFNDCIAMNWDEVEDLGMLCTKDRNPASTTAYGYFTEWWFNYGWSVGGNCLEDLSGHGDWTFSLAGSNPNYIVGEGKSYTGVYTGTVYQAGETLDIKDIVNANPGDTISWETDSKTYFNYTVNGKKAEYHDFSAEIGDGTLTELPAIRDAFSRFCYLSAEGGLNVAPPNNVLNDEVVINYFNSGNIAMVVEQLYYVPMVKKVLKDEWSIAPLPQYKAYTNPKDPSCDTVAKRGETANFSILYNISLSKKSQVKDAAYKFINWIASEGQHYLAKNEHPSACRSDQENMKANSMVENAGALVNILATSRACDWWYMPDSTWIDCWATPLNYEVRQGTMDYNDFLYKYIEECNSMLKKYKE